MNNPYASYKTQSIATMTQGEMINALFEGLQKNLNFAMAHMDHQDYAKTHTCLMKSQDILQYFISTLNPAMPISQNLLAMYEFFINQIVDANVKKEKKFLEDILPMIDELKETFVQADRLSRSATLQK